MKKSDEEKAANARQKMIDKAKEYGADSYCRKFVAPIFQRMIRAEFAAHSDWHGYEPAVVDGDIEFVFHYAGQCVCITCGKVDLWDSGIKGMHTGHFLASRRNSILLEEENCAPQCSSCNYYRSGAASEFRQWMLAVRGMDVIERLEALKRQSVSFDREQLVDMRIEFNRRLKAAELKIKGM
jgi:hypothetical protein